MTDETLADRDGFWVILLGKRFEKIPEDDRTLDNLCDKFYTGRKRIIDKEYGSRTAFIDAITGMDEDTAETQLLTLWAKKKWEEKSTGKELLLDGDFSDEIERLQEDGVSIHELDDDYYLIWPSQSRARIIMEEDDVQGTLLEEAHPIIVRKDDDSTVEVRGGKRRVSRFSGKVLDSEQVDEAEPEYTDRSIIDDMSVLFEQDVGTLKLIEIKFMRTYLPDNSALTLKNNRGVREDLNADNIREEVIDYRSLSDLDFFKFEHVKTGKKVKVNVKHSDEGFQFELDDSYIPEDEKENIREHLADQLGIEFDKVYRYDAQHDQIHIVHKILGQNEDAYERYYGELDEDDQQFIDRFLDVDEETVYKCYPCGAVHEEEEDECPDCGNEDLHAQTQNVFTLKEDEVHAAVVDTLTDIQEADLNNDHVSLRGIDWEDTTISDNPFLKSRFWMEESTNNTPGTRDDHRYEYYIYAYGNGRLPWRINRYLLDTVLVTYGDGFFKAGQHFGEVDLYTLLNREDIAERFVNAVRDSRRLRKMRARNKAESAVPELTKIANAVENGNLDEIEDDYSSNDFERYVFHLLKEMFSFAERWGREGKRETDGCVIIPPVEDDYLVYSYDPKLTFDMDGYDLNAEEKNKAAYYILAENRDDYIRDTLKDGANIDGHIFVSDNFKETQFEPVEEQVRDWFSLAEAEDEMDVPIVFLPLEHLLEIYHIYDEQHDFVSQYNEVWERFVTALSEAFTPDGRKGFTVVDEDDVDNIRANVLDARRNRRHDRDIQEYGE